MYDRRIIRGNTYALNQLPAVSEVFHNYLFTNLYTSVCVELKTRSSGIQEAARGTEKTTGKKESKREDERNLSKASRREKAHRRTD